MIDFAMFIKSDTGMLERMRHFAAKNPDTPFSINHTYHAPLRSQPIAVNIETKLTGTGWDVANVQVGVWVAAQFTRIEQLMLAANGDSTNLSAIPIIIIQGHNWNFLAATRNPDRKTYVWSTVMFGTTLNPLGVYQIIAGVQLLAHWAHTMYRPWFRSSVLGIRKEG